MQVWVRVEFLDTIIKWAVFGWRLETAFAKQLISKGYKQFLGFKWHFKELENLAKLSLNSVRKVLSSLMTDVIHPASKYKIFRGEATSLSFLGSVNKKLVVLTGAGISTECGIPDYRRNLLVLALQDARYSGGENYPVWKKFKEAVPGRAHTALASLEKANRISLMITQNMNRVVHHAGCSPFELHGTVHIVVFFWVIYLELGLNLAVEAVKDVIHLLSWTFINGMFLSIISVNRRKVGEIFPPVIVRLGCSGDISDLEQNKVLEIANNCVGWDIIGMWIVDMDDFRKHTDENVEWIECTEKEVQVPPPFDYEEVDLEEFGSGTESDDPECERKRALKIVSKDIDLLLLAQRRQLWLSRNDKTRMTAECRGKVPGFVMIDPNNGISPLAYAVVVEGEQGVMGEHTTRTSLWRSATATTVQRFGKNMEEIKKLNPEMYNWLKDIPPQHWARSHFSGRPHCDVLLNNMCEVLNRQLLKKQRQNQIEMGNHWHALQTCSCCHLATNGTNNGLEPGIPESWVHESYWLKTWVDMYRFKVNPCNGPELWPESDTPITLTAPNYKPPSRTGPKKKRERLQLKSMITWSKVAS
ncbi:sirtuin 2 [Tanacetum coccineum]